jgi:hypothetical protein
MVLRRHSTSEAFFSSDVTIATLIRNRRSTADVQEYLHHGPEALCYMFRDSKLQISRRSRVGEALPTADRRGSNLAK